MSDGTYDPFKKGQKANLSFYIKLEKIRKSGEKEFYLKQEKYSDYLFCGEVICSYTENNLSLLVIDTGHYKFFIEGPGEKVLFLPGQFIKGKGQIIVDYFIWGESLCKIENAPDIYYDFIIDRILQVSTPEKFTAENDCISISPTSLGSSDYTDNDLVEVIDMLDDESEYSFYLLELRKIDEIVPIT